MQTQDREREYTHENWFLLIFSYERKLTENHPFTHALKSMRLPFCLSYVKHIYTYSRFSVPIVVYFYTILSFDGVNVKRERDRRCKRSKGAENKQQRWHDTTKQQHNNDA